MFANLCIYIYHFQFEHHNHRCYCGDSSWPTTSHLTVFTVSHLHLNGSITWVPSYSQTSFSLITPPSTCSEILSESQIWHAYMYSILCTSTYDSPFIMLHHTWLKVKTASTRPTTPASSRFKICSSRCSHWQHWPWFFCSDISYGVSNIKHEPTNAS